MVQSFGTPAIGDATGIKRRPLGPLQGQPQPGIGGAGVSGPAIVAPAPQPQPGVAPSPTPYAATSTFGPSQNLIGTQIGPQDSQRLQATEGQVNTAQQNVAGFRGLTPFQGIGTTQAPTGLLNQAQSNIGQAQLGPLGGIGNDVGQARSATLSALGSLNNAPSRSQTAQNLYGALSDQETANTGAKIRDLGQRSAALGRLGSGMVTSEAGDIFGQREANLAAIKAQLAAQTSGQEQGDILNRIQAAQGVTQGLGGLDLAQSGLGLQAGQAGANLALDRAGALSGLAGQQFGIGQGQRQEQVGERSARTGQELADLGARQGVLGQLLDTEGQQYGQEAGARNELRGERGYQADLEQQGISNEVRRQELQDQLLGSDYGRQANTLGMLGNLGFQGPSPTGLGLADLYSGQSGDSNAAIAELLRSLGRGQGN